jgi:hypothetical protein
MADQLPPEATWDGVTEQARKSVQEGVAAAFFPLLRSS